MIEQSINAIRELLEKAADGEHEVGNLVCAVSKLVDLVETLCNGDDSILYPEVNDCVGWCAQCHMQFDYPRGNAPEKCPHCGYADWEIPF